jgi:hypothetical protein
MKLYTSIGSQVGSLEAAAWSGRLVAWHDDMVAHERLLRSGAAAADCHEECPHGEARVLWREAVATFNERANDLSFLRSRAMNAVDIRRTHGG